MKKLTILIMLLSTVACNQLSDFHDKEIALEAEYINVLLDKIIDADMQEDISILSRYFVNDSALVWSQGSRAGIRTGWNDFRSAKEKAYSMFDSMSIEVIDRYINVDDLGSVAWFTEYIDANYVVADSLFSMEGIMVSGVLQKPGSDWMIVQYHVRYPCGKDH